MAAKADASQYGIPLEWVASKGELGKHADPGSISKSERLILYNQDVLYHQNKEILQALAKLGGERDADKVPAVLVPAQAAVTAASVSDEPVLNGRKKKNKPMSEQGRELEAWASGIKEHVSYIGKPGFVQGSPAALDAAQSAMPKTVIAKYPGRTAPIPAPTQAVASNALKETRKGVKEMALAIQEAKLAKERAEIREVLQRYQQEEEEKAKLLIGKNATKKRVHGDSFIKDHNSEDDMQSHVVPKLSKRERRSKKTKVEA